jgi:phage terminase large subunit GpA-like protein
MTSEKITNVFSEALQIAIPESHLTVSQHAGTYRYLAPERSARSGRWRNDLTPYLVEIMDSVNQPGVREVVFVKPAQVGGSEAASNICSYFMHADPAQIQYSAETQPKAEAWSTESLATMIRDTPVLANLVREARTRDSGNTIGAKKFPGGQLTIGYATSPATASSRPLKIVILDERDAYVPTSEGDYCAIIEKRTATFDDSVIFKLSTPRNRIENPEGSPVDAPRYSPIELEYENSDKRRYFVPCPHCDEYQVLVWSQAGSIIETNEEGKEVKRVTFTGLKWDSAETASDAYYVCVNGCVIEHESKTEMLARGEWRAEKPFNGCAGFFLNELYSPFVDWSSIVKTFLNAKGNPEKLRVFVNTSLAEGWEEKIDQASVDDLESRREGYGDYLPEGVLVLTAGVDVQGDRLECEIVGWGLDKESWSIDYNIIFGDPSQIQVWRDLKEYLTREWEYEIPVVGSLDEVSNFSKMRVVAAAIDTGGHNTEDVYRFCRANAGRNWYAIKGANTPGKPLVSPPTKQGKPYVLLYTVGTETAKDSLAAHLAITEQGPGFCHFPEEFERDGIVFYGDRYFKQLRSETVITIHNGGVTTRRWEKIKKGLRNEALDVRIYAMFAERRLNPNYRILMTRREQLAVDPPVETPADQAEAGQGQIAGRPPRRGGRGGGGKNWVNGWRY